MLFSFIAGYISSIFLEIPSLAEILSKSFVMKRKNKLPTPFQPQPTLKKGFLEKDGKCFANIHEIF